VAENTTTVDAEGLNIVKTAMDAVGLLTDDLLDSNGNFIENAAAIMLARI